MSRQGYPPAEWGWASPSMGARNSTDDGANDGQRGTAAGTSHFFGAYNGSAKFNGFAEGRPVQSGWQWSTTWFRKTQARITSTADSIRR